jgi:uncharacterized protein
MTTATRTRKISPEIRRLWREIGLAAKAEKVILFGSRARGEAGEDSDADILVLTRNSRLKALDVRRRIRHKLPLDLFVMTTKRFSERLKAGDFFLMDVDEQGVLLYARPGK